MDDNSKPLKPIEQEESATTVRCFFRDVSSEGVKSLIAISKMAHPHWHTPIRDLFKDLTPDELKYVRYEMTLTLTTYLNLALNNSTDWYSSFLNDLKLEPDKKRIIFDEHRDYYVKQLDFHSKFKYLYDDYLGKTGEWNSDTQEAIADEIWHITNKYDQELIDGIWLFQRVYSYFFVIDKLNSWQSTQDSIVVKKQDTQYYLDRDFLNSHDSKYLSEQIQESGFFSINYYGNYAKVYLGPLAAFLISKEVSAKNLEKDTVEIVDGTNYISEYVSEYKKGAEYFNKRYRVSPNILFGEEAKVFGEGLHYQYFHSKEQLGGWNYWRSWMPKIITYSIIKDYGYHAGVISQFEEMAFEYPDLFNKYVFYSCEQEDNTAAIRLNEDVSMSKRIDEPIKLRHPQIAMLYHYNEQSITRNNSNTIAQKYGQTSGQKLLDIYGKMTSPLERTATAKNTLENFSKVIPLLSGKALALATKELAEARKNNSKRVGK